MFDQFRYTYHMRLAERYQSVNDERKFKKHAKKAVKLLEKYVQK